MNKRLVSLFAKAYGRETDISKAEPFTGTHSHEVGPDVKGNYEFLTHYHTAGGKYPKRGVKNFHQHHDPTHWSYAGKHDPKLMGSGARAADVWTGSHKHGSYGSHTHWSHPNPEKHGTGGGDKHYHSEASVQGSGPVAHYYK